MTFVFLVILNYYSIFLENQILQTNAERSFGPGGKIFCSKSILVFSSVTFPTQTRNRLMATVS